MTEYQAEFIRKLIHLSSLWIPLTYFYFGRSCMFCILLPMLFFVLVVDYVRNFFPSLAVFVNKYLSSIMRENEKEAFVFSGASYMLIAAAVTTLLFSKEIAIFSFSVLIISDTCAALVGKKFGRIRFLNKSLEGSVSFFISGLMVYYVLFKYYEIILPLSAVFLSVFTATIVELFSKKVNIDDNISIPFSMAVVLSVLVG
jgi:dolichol kinase